jgi:branched-subunit amino acid transport protein
MDILALILVTATLVYGCRLAGFALDLGGPSPRRDQLLRFVPLSVLPALITLSILREPQFSGVKLVALVMVGVVILAIRRRRSDSAESHNLP